ncbi:hypothetical protein MCHI_002261 [Candidatus Magnetoovum chiemensis]|nr:hypothetical protein MCHI_002261 [Candidatus Magnetoovum chiemensis]
MTELRRKASYAVKRIGFLSISAVSIISGVGVVVFSPLLSYWIFGNVRPWLFIRKSPRFAVYFLRFVSLYFKGTKGVSVSLTAPPMKKPDKDLLKLNPQWEHGESCGTCSRCCTLLPCVLNDTKNHVCLGYNSFVWNYFNCGRYPRHQLDIDRFDCLKWIVKEKRG